MKLEMDFISSESFSGKSSEEKINFILKRVKKNKIVVIEGILHPVEEMKLIKATMTSINGKFTGIEVYTLRRTSTGWFQRLVDSLPLEKFERVIEYLTGKRIDSGLKRGLTFIGPSRIIKKIKRKEKSFSVLAEI